MKKEYKSTAILIGIALLILTLGGLYANGLRKERDISQTALEKMTQTVTSWQDSEGRARAEVKSISAQSDIVKSVYKTEIDSLRKLIPDIGRKGKGLIEATTVSTQIRDSIILKTIYDTIVVKNKIQVIETLTYADKWIDFRYRLDHSILVYTVRDSLSIVKYNKKQGLFKPKMTSVQVVSHNPNSSITGLSQFEVEHKPKKIQFGLQLGYGITNSGFSPYAGVGFTFKIW
jgi:hypothetical protein